MRRVMPHSAVRHDQRLGGEPSTLQGRGHAERYSATYEGSRSVTATRSAAFLADDRAGATSAPRQVLAIHRRGALVQVVR